MLNDKEILILETLLDADKELNSYEIADLTGLSTRTIRYDINSLKDILKLYDGEIVSKPNKGYKLYLKHKEKFKKILENLKDKSRDIPINSKERVDYLFTRLILSDDYIKLDDIAEEIHISRNVLSKDLKIVRNNCNKYDLKIIAKANLGIKLVGNEIDKRKCMSEYFFHESVTVFSNLKGVGIDSKEMFNLVENIKSIVIDFLFEYKIKLYGVAFENLVAHISIAIYRIKMKKYVSTEENFLKKLINTKEGNIAREMVKEIEDKVNIRFPEEEIAYIAMHLLGKKLLEDADINSNESFMFEDKIDLIVTHIIEGVSNKFGYNFKGDKELYLALGIHLRPTLNRISLNMIMRNPLLNEIKSNYPVAFEMGTLASSIIYAQTQLNLCEDEISYLALHFQYAMVRNKKDKKNVVFVCATGKGTSQLVAVHIEEKLHEFINIIEIIDLYNLKKIDFNNVDYVLSTIPIPIELPVPVLNVPFFLDDNDIKNIRGKMFEDGERKSLFYRYFKENLFKIEVDCKNKEETFEIFDGMASREFGIKKGELAYQIKRREDIISTEYGNLVAVPHPLELDNDESFISVLVLKKPIVWDKKKVQLVILIALTKEETGLQSLYRTIAKFINNKEEVKKSLQSCDLKEFLDYVLKYLV